MTELVPPRVSGRSVQRSVPPQIPQIQAACQCRSGSTVTWLSVSSSNHPAVGLSIDLPDTAVDLVMPLQGFLRRYRKSETDLLHGDRDIHDNPLEPSVVPPLPTTVLPDSRSLVNPISAASRESALERPSVDYLAPSDHLQSARSKLSFTNFRYASDSQLATTARRQGATSSTAPHRSELPSSPSSSLPLSFLLFVD